jgi:hypothetical protein
MIDLGDAEHRRRVLARMREILQLMEDRQAVVKDTRRPLVIAGTHRQFLDWCRETKTDPRNARFVNDWHSVAGLDPKDWRIYRYGTFPERFYEIHEYLTGRGFKLP